MPVRSSCNDPKRREKTLLDEGKAIVETLSRAKTRGEALALLAAGISKLHGIPLKLVLSLRGADIAGGRVRLSTNTFTLAIPLAAAVTRWSETMPTDLVFRSPRTGRALSPSAIAYHVSKTL